MRRFRNLTRCSLAAVAVSTIASAQIWVPGHPVDAEIADAGSATTQMLIGVATNAGYSVVHGGDGGFTVESANPTISYTSVYFDGSGCPYLYPRNQQYISQCGVNYGFQFPTTADLILRVRHTPSGAAYAQVAVDGSGQSLQYDPGFGPNAWSNTGALIAITSVLSALEYQGVQYGLAATTGGELVLAADGGWVGSQGGTDAGVGPLNEVQLYGTGGEVRALLGTAAGLWQVPFQNGAQLGTATQTSIDAGFVSGIAFAMGTGGASGDGFGMAVVDGGAGYEIYGAVPDPAHPAEQWMRRSKPTFSGGDLQRVSCAGGSACVFTSSIDNGTTGTVPNLVVYENRHRPTVGLGGLSINDAQTTPSGSNSWAEDLDGDPYFMTWALEPGTPATVSLPDGGPPHPQHDWIELMPSGLQCTGTSTKTYRLYGTISDGYAPNTSTQIINVDITHAVPPGAPTVQPDPAVPIPSGSAPIHFTAYPSDAGCAATVRWSGTTPTGYTIESDGGDLWLTPPLTVCQQLGETVSYTATANDRVLQTPQSVTFHVDPWGMPEAPFPPDAGATQRGDAGATYTPRATHACADAGGFPGVATQWLLDATAPVAPEATASGLPVGSGAFTPALTLRFPDCTNETYVLGARNFLGDAGTSTSYLTIDVNTPMLDVQAANVWLRVDAGTVAVAGELSSDVNCAASRGLQGHFSVRHVLTDTIVETDAGPIPGTYTVPLSTGCSGGDFSAVGWISDPDGGTRSSTAVSFHVPQLDAGATLIGSTLTTHCGEIARGTVTATFPGVCPLSEVSWSQVDDGSPPLQLVPNGTSVALQAGDGGLDGLIGSWVRVRASLDAGLGNVAEETQPLQIVPDSPFVTLVHDTDAPVAEETGILGVRVRITNETACPVTNVSLHEDASGLRYIPGTARLDGVPLEAGATAPELVFDGISLAAHQTRTLTYSARPPMLGRVSPKGWATMNGVHVSDTRGLATPPPGCGCGQSPGEAMAFAAVLLAWAARRRLRARS